MYFSSKKKQEKGWNESNMDNKKKIGYTSAVTEQIWD